MVSETSLILSDSRVVYALGNGFGLSKSKVNKVPSGILVFSNSNYFAAAIYNAFAFYTSLEEPLGFFKNAAYLSS